MRPFGAWHPGGAGCGFPGLAEGGPRLAEGAPGDAEGAPGGAEGTPGDAEGAPGGAEGAPGGAEGAPGATVFGVWRLISSLGAENEAKMGRDAFGGAAR